MAIDAEREAAARPALPRRRCVGELLSLCPLANHPPPRSLYAPAPCLRQPLTQPINQPPTHPKAVVLVLGGDRHRELAALALFHARRLHLEGGHAVEIVLDYDAVPLIVSSGAIGPDDVGAAAAMALASAETAAAAAAAAGAREREQARALAVQQLRERVVFDRRAVCTGNKSSSQQIRMNGHGDGSQRAWTVFLIRGRGVLHVHLDGTVRRPDPKRRYPTPFKCSPTHSKHDTTRRDTTRV